jgi:hypothetical protein
MAFRSSEKPSFLWEWRRMQVERMKVSIENGRVSIERGIVSIKT